MAALAHDYQLRLVLIGDSGCGKSSLLQRYCEDDYNPNYVATVGIDYRIQTISVGGYRVKLQIWDTAGQEKFRSIARAHYAGACGILLLYDVTWRDSFTALDSWLGDVEKNSGPDTPVVLVGNKVDLLQEKEVTSSEAQEYARRRNLPWYEVSAKDGRNVKEVFAELIRLALDFMFQRNPRLKRPRDMVGGGGANGNGGVIRLGEGGNINSGGGSQSSRSGCQC